MRSVLLGGGTDPPYIKIKANGADLYGPAGRDGVAPGIFVCAMGCLLPLFLPNDIIPTTVSSGWLMFTNQYQTITSSSSHPRCKKKGGGVRLIVALRSFA